MSDLILYSIILFTIYIGALIALSFFSTRGEDGKSYVIGNRNIGLFTTTCSMLAGQFNGGGVFFIITFGALFGFGMSFVASIGFLIGYVIQALLAKNIRKEAGQYGDITVPDLLNRRIGNKTAYFSGFIIVGKALLFGTAQILIAGKIIAAVFDLEDAYGIYGTAFVIGIYVYMGGYLTIVRTDILQWLFLFCVSVGIAVFVPFPGTAVVFNDFVEMPAIEKWGFIIFFIMLILSNADPWQRVMSAKNEKTAKQSLLFSGILISVFSFAVHVIVADWKNEIGHGFTFFSLFVEEALPALTLSILGIFTLTAVMSTIDTQIYLFTSAIMKNVLRVNPETDQKKYIRFSRIGTISLLVFIAVVASSIGSTIEFIVKAFSFAYILAPIMIMAMIWGSKGSDYKDRTAVLALLAGLGVYIPLFFNGSFAVIINNVIPATVTAVICLIGAGISFFTKKRLTE